ncbi:sporulation protein [Clostridium sp. YIM B02555]|uniref:sporulation protein n=1 Tax=Clostridium sp. YIM B02555 TaxID=2911968 RepID=UPI001EEDDB2C|nr:sporulation protein [Clostridium sp. YIM B02555]
MSFFKRAMASMGIGSAKIDTVLEGNSFRVGEEFNGKIYVKGGNVDQYINKITVKLMTYYLTEEIKRTVDDNDNEKEEIITERHNIVIDQVEFVEAFTVEAKQTLDFDFSFKIPEITPITLERQAVWIETDLDIASGIDSSDRDYIEILPHPYAQHIFDIFAKIGFQLIECEQKYTNFDGRSLPIVQEFKFKPTNFLNGEVDDVEIIFNLYNNGLEMLVEIDRKLRGIKGFFLECLDLDESVIRIRFDGERFENDNGEIQEEICNRIMQNAQVC